MAGVCNFQESEEWEENLNINRRSQDEIKRVLTDRMEPARK